MKQSPDLYVSHTCTHSFYLPTLFLISKWKQYDIIHSSLCFLLRCSVIYPSFLSSKCGEQFALLVKATLNQKRLFSALVEQQEGIIKLCCTWNNFLLLFPSVGQFTAQPPPEVAQPPPEEFKWTQHTITLSLQIPDMHLTGSEENRIGNSSEFLHILLIRCPGRNQYQLSSCPGS